MQPQELKEIYCINLNDSPHRKKQMEDLFKSLKIDIPVFHFSAIRGSLVTNWDVPMVKGHIGCLLSHMLMWSIIAEKKGNDFYLVLEDDLMLEDDINPITLMDDIHTMTKSVPRSIGFIHCSRDINKMFIKNKRLSKYKPRYKTIGKVQEREIKKCSPLNPWSTETGAILMRPKNAKSLLKYARWALKYHKRLPFNPHVDLLLSYWPSIHFGSAMVKIFQQNTGSNSDLKTVNSEPDMNESTIYYGKDLFAEAVNRLTPWVLD